MVGGWERYSCRGGRLGGGRTKSGESLTEITQSSYAGSLVSSSLKLLVTYLFYFPPEEEAERNGRRYKMGRSSTMGRLVNSGRLEEQDTKDMVEFSEITFLHYLT